MGSHRNVRGSIQRIFFWMFLVKASIQNRKQNTKINLEEVLNELLDEAVKRGIIEDSIVYRDLFDTKLMNCLMPRPAQVQKEFWSL